MTLLAPAFLLGLLAIGLPLWLHRLSAENPNRRRFSSLMFLEAGEPRRVLAKRLQYLLLLALRIGVLALLALVFAQPALNRSAAGAAEDGARLHLLVMDTSGSMAYEDRWEEAQDLALDVLDGLPADDRAGLVAAGRVTQVLAESTVDRGEIARAINTLSPGVFHLDYGRLMRSLDGVLRSAELPVVLHVVGDAQQSALPTRFAELAPREAAEIEVHEVTAADADNWLVEALTGSAVSGELTASVRSFASEPADKTVRLEHNGERVDEQSVTVAAGGRADVSFPALDLEEGSNRVSVSLAPADGLPADDARYIALQRPEPRPVLLVSGDLRGNDTLYLASAMETLSGLALRAEQIDAPALADRQPLTDYHFVIVADAGALGPGETALLEDYVETGGAVLMGLGPRSNSMAAVPLTGHTFRPRTSNAANDGYASIGAIDAGHPALRGIDGLRSAPFTRYAAVTPAPEDDVLMRLDDGTPLLLEREVGAGRVLLFTSSFDRQWNDLPVQAAFVPLIAGLADHMLGGAGFTNEAELGSVLSLQSMGLSGGQIFDPDGDPALALGAGTDAVLLDQIGFYEVASGGRTELVAVNFDTAESDLAAADRETLARWEELGRSPDEAAAAQAAVDGETYLAPLAQWLLVLLLAMLVMESSVGNWHLRVRRGMAA